ncbi:prepilin peptidase CpaA [Paenibacillus forsythiae]|uniref:Prepilin peptidase CpaA n=1 Tax=Paenibacillus forsythiae TaxID=365616 RepID=A0ABU3H5E2_9BACL|nr:A24 family peptidase [Paenibacillus forsythiae]MDT3426038.1 prepilin peptidase CpaA [Paenibacillus forsythiae]
MNEWAFWGCLPFLGAAFLTDMLTMKIPNWITVPAMLAGLMAQGLTGGWRGLLFAGAGAAAGFMLLLIMHIIGAVGAGDVKLFAGIGAWTGLLFTAQVIVYSLLFAAAIGWIIMLKRRETFRRLRSVARLLAGVFYMPKWTLFKGHDCEMLRFPFMLAVMPGAVTAFLGGWT